MTVSRGSARIDLYGKVTQIGSKPAPDEVVTETDVQEPAKLSRLLTRLLRDVAALRRQWVPRTLDFEDIVAPSSGTISLQHNFGGRVRWWVVDVSGGSTYRFQRSTDTTANTLVLSSFQANNSLTIRVQEAG